MKTIAVVCQKGGAGKTTIATALAVAGRKKRQQVTLFDLDPQASASFWAELRDDESPKVIDCQPVLLPRRLDQERKAGCDLAVIDTPPVAKDTALEAGTLADFVLIPCRPDVLDFQSVAQTIQQMQQFSRPYAVLLNQVPPNGGPEVREVIEALEAMDAPLCPVQVCQRKAHARAQKDGLTAQELDPDSKASDEIQRLYAYTIKRLRSLS